MELNIGWIVDADVSGFFDSLDHGLLREVIRKRVNDGGLLRLIGKWLHAGALDGEQLTYPERGSPQGGMRSPLLANLFLHDVVDKWMDRSFPDHPWARYAADGVVHCRTEAEARQLLAALQERFKACGLARHPDKTRIVDGKDDDRRGEYPETRCDVLGYTCRPRRAKNRYGKFFVSFTPGVSNEAAKAMRQMIHDWRMHLKPDQSLEDLSRMVTPVLRGWINYYGGLYKSALDPTLRYMNWALVHWVRRKDKRVNRHRRRAAY
jgi:RNA-directed DNA polymerase